MITSFDIETARREYVAAMGTTREMVKRKRLEWLVQEAKLQSQQRHL
jgi:hypothetical protein